MSGVLQEGQELLGQRLVEPVGLVERRDLRRGASAGRGPGVRAGSPGSTRKRKKFTHGA